VLDGDGQVMFASSRSDLPEGPRIPVDTNADFRLMDLNGKTCFVPTGPTGQAFVGSRLPLEDRLFAYKKGERDSTLVRLGDQNFALGLQVSDGYREYKIGYGYVNGVICLVLVPA